MKFSIITLGCDKNTVDSERIAADLVAHGAICVPEPSDAEVIIVNTCAFIDAAKEESIDTLLQAASLKETTGLRALVAVGCMVERYRVELERSIPEVDLFLGLRDLPELIPQLTVRGLLDGRERKHPGSRLHVGGLRHIAYLKVSEGCDHKCAFCAIPLWRGRHRSFDPDSLVEEARALETRGVVELNLVAQDLAHFGRDLEEDVRIHNLLEQLIAATQIPWFRLLYIYSAGLRPALVELMAKEDRLLSYIDMPIQHASDTMLKSMRRPERADRLREKIAWLRREVPDLTLRTTVVVGFPGETDSDFEVLLEFIKEIEFDHLGAFAFSPQPGTPGAEMLDHVSEPIKLERLAALNDVQRTVVAARNQARVGNRAEVLVDRVNGQGGAGQVEGRLRSQAHEIDGVTHLTRNHVDLEPGDLVLAEITAADDADLWATPRGRSDRARPPAEYLPSNPLDLATAWGR